LFGIQWSGANGFSSTLDNPVIARASVQHTGMYIVKASSVYNCGAIPDTLEIKVLPAVVLDMEDTLIACNGEEVLLYSHASHADYYRWSTGDTTENSRASSYGIYVLKAGNQRCTSSDSTFVLAVNVQNVQIQTSGDVCEEGKAELSVEIDSVFYQWNTGETTASIAVSSEGSYSVKVFVGTCQAEQSIEIVCPCKLSLPNVFTPNGDGYNDVYLPEIKAALNTFSMYIYDRWGNIVYHTETFTPWNGTINGQQASAGVYYCVVFYSCMDTPQTVRTAQSSVSVFR
jgi:gliding motility-associated-like protein